MFQIGGKSSNRLDRSDKETRIGEVTSKVKEDIHRGNQAPRPAHRARQSLLLSRWINRKKEENQLDRIDKTVETLNNQKKTRNRGGGRRWKCGNNFHKKVWQGSRRIHKRRMERRPAGIRPQAEEKRKRDECVGFATKVAPRICSREPGK